MTFGAGRTGWRQAANRIAREARSTEIFSHIIELDKKWLKDFSPSTYAIVRQFQSLKLYKGFGYMVWKPLIFKWAKLQFPNSNILYMDAGFHIDQNLKHRIKLKNLLLENSKNGLAWQLPNHKEVYWSKKEVVLRIHPPQNVLQSGQVQSGFIFTPIGGEFVEMLQVWDKIAKERDGFYFSDEIEIDQNPSFVAHRHDQSSFSMLWKMHEFGVKGDVTNPENLGNFPVIAMRNNSKLPAISSHRALTNTKNINLLKDKIFRRR